MYNIGMSILTAERVGAIFTSTERVLGRLGTLPSVKTTPTGVMVVTGKQNGQLTIEHQHIGESNLADKSSAFAQAAAAAAFLLEWPEYSSSFHNTYATDSATVGDFDQIGELPIVLPPGCPLKEVPIRSGAVRFGRHDVLSFAGFHDVRVAAAVVYAVAVNSGLIPLRDAFTLAEAEYCELFLNSATHLLS